MVVLVLRTRFYPEFHLITFSSSGSCRNLYLGFRTCFCFTFHTIIQCDKEKNWLHGPPHDRHTRTSKFLMMVRKLLKLSAEGKCLTRDKRRMRRVQQWTVTVLQPHLQHITSQRSTTGWRTQTAQTTPQVGAASSPGGHPVLVHVFLC